MFEVVSAVELGLGANTKLPIDRLQWTTDGIMFPHPGPVVTSKILLLDPPKYSITLTHA